MQLCGRSFSQQVTGYMSSESVLETSLHSLFLKQIQILRESALAHFKSATTSEAMPSGFAFSMANSLSSREAEESKRPGSGWSYKNESIDAQNTMQEIATQRKHLLSSQVATAQQHANATHPRPRRPYGRRVTRTARRSPKCRRRTRRSYPPGFPRRTSPCSRGRWPCCP
jgi:predicted phage gp36 major capsid-like protein